MLVRNIKSKIKRKTELQVALLKRVKKEKFSEKVKDQHDTSISIIHDVDVLVVGGGVSGIIAALAASRNGAKTILIEQHGMLGGLATMGLIPPVSNQYFDASGKQVMKGLADELMTLLAEAGGTIEDWKDWKIPKYPFDIEVFKLVVYDMLKKSDVEVLLNTSFSELKVKDEEIEYVIIETSSGRKAIKAKIFIDCTGTAVLAIEAGAPCSLNSDLSNSDSVKEITNALFKKIGWANRTEKTASLQFAVTNVDFKMFYDYIIENEDSYDVYMRGELKEDIELFKYLWNEKGMFYIPHTRNFEKEIKDALETNFFKKHAWRYSSIGECGISLDGLKLNGIITVTANKVIIDPFNDEDITKALIEGQDICYEAYRFFKKYIPGFGNSVLISIAPMLGIRRTAQIIGKKIYTVEEREQELQYDDVVGLYSRKTKNAREVPFSCMIPQKVDNLFVASGRSVSTDDFVMFRTKPHCMILGEAAGAAAAICIRKHIKINDLEIRELQKALLNQSVYLGDDRRLNQLGLL